MSSLPKLSGAILKILPKDDGMIKYRGDWIKGGREMFKMFTVAGYKEDNNLTGDFFAQLWLSEKNELNAFSRPTAEYALKVSCKD